MIFNEKMQNSNRIYVEWVLPESMTYDIDLNSDLDKNTYFSDNIFVKVSCLEYAFDVGRRFVICLSEHSINIFPEVGWCWDEHADLSEMEREIFEFILKNKPNLLIPTEGFKTKLMSFLRKEV